MGGEGKGGEEEEEKEKEIGVIYLTFKTSHCILRIC